MDEDYSNPTDTQKSEKNIILFSENELSVFSFDFTKIGSEEVRITEFVDNIIQEEFEGYTYTLEINELSILVNVIAPANDFTTQNFENGFHQVLTAQTETYSNSSSILTAGPDGILEVIGIDPVKVNRNYQYDNNFMSDGILEMIPRNDNTSKNTNNIINVNGPDGIVEIIEHGSFSTNQTMGLNSGFGPKGILEIYPN